MHDELIDLVDAHGVVIATMNRSEVFAQGFTNFRLVCALIKNNEGKIFIPRRSAHKLDYPNALACVGGCVKTGETYEQGLRREVLEEVMINIDTVSYKFLGFVSPYTYKVKGYIAAYEILIPFSEVQFEKNDFSEALWLFPEQIKERISTGDVATNNLLTLLDLFYLNL